MAIRKFCMTNKNSDNKIIYDVMEQTPDVVLRKTQLHFVLNMIQAFKQMPDFEACYDAEIYDYVREFKNNKIGSCDRCGSHSILKPHVPGGKPHPMDHGHTYELVCIWDDVCGQ